MRKLFVVLSAATLATLLLSSTVVRADQISWGYGAADTTIGSDVASPDATPTSTITFKGGNGSAGGASGIIIYGLTTQSTATTTSDTFTNTPFQLAVTLTDNKGTGSLVDKTNSSGTVFFTGTLSASSVTSTSIIPGSITWTQFGTNTSPLKATINLGAPDEGWRAYTVTINSSTEPGVQGGSQTGSIQAIVTIADGTDPSGSSAVPGTPGTAPEPASLILAGLGLPLILFTRRRLQKENVENIMA